MLILKELVLMRSSLLTMMTKYAEWDRYIQRFGGITIKPQAFKEILEVVDEAKLIEIAKRSGALGFQRNLFYFGSRRKPLNDSRIAQVSVQ